MRHHIGACFAALQTRVLATVRQAEASGEAPSLLQVSPQLSSALDFSLVETPGHSHPAYGRTGGRRPCCTGDAASTALQLEAGLVHVQPWAIDALHGCMAVCCCAQTSQEAKTLSCAGAYLGSEGHVHSSCGTICPIWSGTYAVLQC